MLNSMIQFMITLGRTSTNLSLDYCFLVLPTNPPPSCTLEDEAGRGEAKFLRFASPRLALLESENGTYKLMFQQMETNIVRYIFSGNLSYNRQYILNN